MRGLVNHFRQVYSEAELPERVVYVLVLGITLTGIVLASIDPTHVDEVFAAEDGVVEWLTVFGLALGVGVCVFRVIKLYAHRARLFTLATALLALMLFFVAGEEISWGQRIFGVDTPEWFKVYNLQQETNIHNLTIHGKEIRQPIFTYGLGGAMILYLLVITPLYGRAPALAR